MGVSYKRLFKLLIDRNMKKKDLQQAASLSPASVTKLAKDEYVSMEVLVKVPFLRTEASFPLVGDVKSLSHR